MIRLVFALLGALVATASTALSCPFCPGSGTTLSQDAASAALVLYGIPKNARIDPNEPSQGTTDLEIEIVIKSHPILGGKQTITLPKYLPQVDPKNPMKLLVFCDVYKGQLDPYRGSPFKAESRVAKYLQGALALPDKDAAKRLRFFFDYLTDPDPEISEDAIKEFGNADYKDYRPVAEKFPADQIRSWLKDPGTPLPRLGLYGSMLGHCGKPEDAGLLRSFIEDTQKRYVGGIDGVMAGLVMIDPKGGWKTVADILSDHKKEFLLRYAALRTARFFWEFRPDVIGKDQVAESVSILLDQPDLADLAIEDLRKWGYWKAAPKVRGLFGKPGYEVPFVRKAILRYMMRCPASEFSDAPTFVAEQRTKNPQWVEEVESLLNAESTPLPATNSKSK